MSKTNIILFGGAGVGKSSVVNNLSGGKSVAGTSSGAKSCTFESSPFEVDIYGMPATLWDTAGLDEGDEGRVPNSDAIVQVYKLVRSLSDGVSLLMFIMRATRYKESVPANWKLLYEVICQKNVPIVMVITGLEGEEDRDQWWWENKEMYRDAGIYPDGVACVTTWRGKMKNGQYTFDEEYAESRDKIQRLIRSTCLAVPWKVPAAQWFKDIADEYETVFCFWKRKVARQEYKKPLGEACEKLVDLCGMSKSDVEALAKKVHEI